MCSKHLELLFAKAYRILESLRLEKNSKITKSNRKCRTPEFSLKTLVDERLDGVGKKKKKRWRWSWVSHKPQCVCHQTLHSSSQVYLYCRQTMSRARSDTAVPVRMTRHSWVQPSGRWPVLKHSLSSQWVINFESLGFQVSGFPSSGLVPFPWMMKWEQSLCHRYYLAVSLLAAGGLD